MNDADDALTPEQKLLHAIFGPIDDVQRLADKTDDVFYRIKQRLTASRTVSPPFVSRMEACGMVRTCMDRMLNLVQFDAYHFFDPDNFEAGEFNNAIEVYALDLAAVVCRMLVDLDFTEPVENSGNNA